LACSGCWIPQWVSLLIFNIFIALGNNFMK
jgi:hypothetical protein